MNFIRLGVNDLVPLDYSDLLEKILRVLRHQNSFSISGEQILIFAQGLGHPSDRASPKTHPENDASVHFLI